MTSRSPTLFSLQRKVSFQTKTFGYLAIKGSIDEFQGNNIINENDLENSNYIVSNNTWKIDIGNVKKDKYLKKQDFFFVKDSQKSYSNLLELKKKMK